MAHHCDRPVDVGVGRADGEHNGSGCRRDRSRRTDCYVEQVGERHGGSRSEHADGRDGQAQVKGRRNGQRDRDHPRELPGGVGEPGSERRDGLPADERQHESGCGVADGKPSVRREWAPVREPRGRDRSDDRHGHDRDQQHDQNKLGAGAGPQPGRRQAEHDEDQEPGHRGTYGEAAAGERRDVAGSDQADNRRAAHDPGQEAPAGHPAGSRT
jgi:hypothetical protein